jgi:hypothetical protein
MGSALGCRERARVTMNVPVTSGDYASERITFGADQAGQIDGSFIGVTALLETCPAGATLELWLPQVADGTLSGSDRTDANYFYAGQVLGPAGVANTPTGATASFGSATWPLAGYPGAQLRAKSGGTSGGMTVSATAD